MTATRARSSTPRPLEEVSNPTTTTPFSGMLSRMPTLSLLHKHLEQQYGHNLAQMPHVKKTAFVIVQHGFLNTGPMLEVLFKLGIESSQIFISTKPQTTSPRMREYLTNTFGDQHIRFTYPDEKTRFEDLTNQEYQDQSAMTYGKLIEIIKRRMVHAAEGRKFNNIVACDEGGVVLGKLLEDPYFKEFNMIAVEHTNCGTRSDALFHLNIPYISMAKSYAKLKIESLLIAKAVFRALEPTLERLIDSRHKQIALVGLGNIGQGILTLLANKYEENPDITIVVYDNNSAQYEWLTNKQLQAGATENKWKKILILDQLEARDENYIDINAIKQWASIFLGCTGVDIFEDCQQETLLEALSDNLSDVLETYLFSCSSGKREFKSILNLIDQKSEQEPDKVHTDSQKIIHYESESGKYLSVYNIGLPANFVPGDESSLTAEEAQLTNAIKLAAIIQATYMIQLLPSLRCHPEAHKWLKNFTRLALQPEIINWFCEAIQENKDFDDIRLAITEARSEPQGPDNFPQDKSSFMPTLEDLRIAYLSYFASTAADDHLPTDKILPSPGTHFHRAINKIIQKVDTQLSKEKEAISCYLASKTINQLPENMTPTDYVIDTIEKEESNQKLTEDNIEEKTTALNDMVANYLASDDPLLLLLGDPGVGKTMLVWDQVQQLFHRQITHQPGIHWLPIVIELKNYSLLNLNELVKRHLINKHYLTEDEILALSSFSNSEVYPYKFVIFLEGIDELKDSANSEARNNFQDCVKTCLENSSFSSEQVKFIATCRTNFFQSIQEEKVFFEHNKEHSSLAQSYQRQILLPYKQNTIEYYLELNLAKFQQEKPEEEKITLYEYLEVINHHEEIKYLVRNPLLLRLFMEALPELKKQESNLEYLNRYNIYDAFINNWFTREINRLDAAIKNKIKLSSSCETNALSGTKNIFIQYAVLLAGEMHRKNTLEINIEAHGGETIITWDQIEEKLLTEIKSQAQVKLSAEYKKLRPADRADLADKFNIHNAKSYIAFYLQETKISLRASLIEGLDSFQRCCPLQSLNGISQFIHKSVFEFLLAKGIVLYAGSEKDNSERAQDTLKFLGVHEQQANRRIHHEPEALHFLKDYWAGHGHEDLFVRIKETLFDVILASRNHPEHGPAAANAVTILNWVGVMLTDKKWQNIHIPGAYLPYAVLLRTDLSYAFLENVNLLKAQLTETVLTGVRGNNILFSENFGFNTHTECSTIAHHPKKPWIAVGHVDGTVRQLDLKTFCWIGEKYVGHKGAVIQIIYAPNGSRLSSLGSDGKLVIWREASTKPIAYFGDNITCIAYSSRADFIALGTQDGLIHQIRTSTNTLLISGSDTKCPKVTSVCYSYDDKLIISGDENGIVSFFYLSAEHAVLSSEWSNFNTILNRKTQNKINKPDAYHQSKLSAHLEQSLKSCAIHQIVSSPIESIIIVTLSNKEDIFYDYAKKEGESPYAFALEEIGEQNKAKISGNYFLCFIPTGEIAMLWRTENKGLIKTIRWGTPGKYDDNFSHIRSCDLFYNNDLSDHNSDATYTIFHS